MQTKTGLDLNLLATLKTQAMTEAEILPRRFYRQRRCSILAIVTEEMLQQMDSHNTPSRQGLNSLTQLPEWKTSFSLQKLDESIPFSEEALSNIANQSQQAWTFLPPQHILRPYYQELLKASTSLLALQYDRSIFDL